MSITNTPTPLRNTLFTVAWLALAANVFVSSASGNTLTNATQVRALTTEEAATHIPVRLRGVVIDEAGQGVGVVMRDETAGIYFEGTQSVVAKIRRGDLIEIEGVSDPGGFAPFVRLQKYRKLGTAPIPEPQHVTFEQLINGKLDAQWVEVSGVVRNSEPANYSSMRGKLELATGGERLAVRTSDPLTAGAYVDAEVTLRGVCFNQHNANRQLVSPMLHVPVGSPIFVSATSPADPYSLPLTPVATLMQFEPQGNYGHRVHVRGVVTFHRAGQFLWLRENGRGLKIQTKQADTVRAGDEVDVLGFPNRGDYTPILEDAVFRVVKPGDTPAPTDVTTTTAAVEHDADLIEFEAALRELKPVIQGSNLVAELSLNWGTDSVKALLQLPLNQQIPKEWSEGSLLRVVGICSVTRDESGPVSGIWTPRSFRLLLRSMADVNVAQPPPRWTLERIFWLFVAISITSLLVAAGAMMVARRRLKEQATRRALAEAEFAAILKERNRVAREIHDTLAQGLGAISMRLELAKNELKTDAAAATQHIEAAHQQARGSLAEARNSIWNMRSQVLEKRDLPGALSDILRQLTDGTGIEIKCPTRNQPRRLPPVVENDLLRIGQEAITNAVKHARAKHIELAFDLDEKRLELSVKDDGCGYDGNTTRITKRGFGLVGMRERATQLRGELTVRSKPGEGTEIKFTMPAPG